MRKLGSIVGSFLVIALLMTLPAPVSFGQQAAPAPVPSAPAQAAPAAPAPQAAAPPTPSQPAPVPQTSAPQNLLPQVLQQGGIPQQVQDALKGQSPQQIPQVLQQLQQEGKLGNLTPAEIEAGKKALEQQQQKAVEKPAEAGAKPAEPQIEVKPPSQTETKTIVEQKPAELPKEAKPP
jgi:hypothetical protein